MSERQALPGHPRAAEAQRVADFETATAVTKLGDGRYATDLDPDWSGPFGANGGILAATMLNAAQLELDGSRLPARIINAHYLARSSNEPATIAVRPLREGRKVTTVHCEFTQGDQLTCMATITFSAVRFHHLDLAERAPAVPDPELVREPPAELFEVGPPSLGRLRILPCIGAAPGADAAEGVTGGWISMRDDAPGQLYDAARLVALSDLWWPAVFGATTELVGTPTLALTVHLRSSAPGPGPLLARFQTHTVSEGHLDETGKIWSPDGELLADSRQLAVLTGPFPSRNPR